ncbi:flagellar hook-associated protein FlgL [Helicobacter kayseriensis]|uniref:flagellar hook-associated protein FlgL n=1 Tax=Helicobacter kayseriensis TaxID=2905877 RepID=UPI001E3E6CE3|nr:flagellar hook-associated protein FlgL [Helicobacter kayseriensis]MCE3047410.1 flagellar hook-associated protein FlgL [Helicobacter kayseriensis]MCE3048919.1 flagellar hook-associated protein FlgL [Helicobacter kayseriensis]
MRITFGSKYNQIQNSQGSLQSRLNELNAKIASGKKIQSPYENSHIYEKDLQLGYQESTLSQNIDVAQNAYNMTLSTDKALSEFNKALLQFKTKLIQVANQPQSPSTRMAIANELSGLRDHMINISNTSIGGAYLFSGTKIRTQPIAPDGKYMGNNQKLEALVGSNIRVPFNIPGSDLFFGYNADSQAMVTSNIKRYNLSKLHPNIMDRFNKDTSPQEIFLKATDTLRDLIGDDDDDPSNDKKVYFYLRGVRPDGTRFKSKFELDQAYTNLSSATKVSDLLEKIGREFGNNQATQVVDVQLNAWGEIEIKSLVAGSSNLDFNLLASTVDADNIQDIEKSGAPLISFQKSPYLSSHSISQIQGIQDPYKQDQLVLPASLISQTTKIPANKNTMLSEIFNSDVVSIRFDGDFSKEEDGEKIPQILSFSTKETKIYDVLKDIEAFYQQNGHNVQTEIADGKIILIDLDAKQSGQATTLKMSLSTHDQEGNLLDGIPSDYHHTYDDVFFEKRGSKLVSNISQISLSNDRYATDQTKLFDVAGDISGQIYNLSIKDHNGKNISAKMVFNPRGVYLELPRQTPKEQESSIIKIPVVNLNEKGALNLAKPSEMTYRQFMDALGLVMNYSNFEDKVYEELSKNPDDYTPKQKELYEKILLQSQGKVEVSLNQNGQVEIIDRVRSTSQMEFSLSSATSDDFSDQALRDTQTGLILHANNALTVNRPQLNLFDSLNQAIQAVQDGIYRPDEFSQAFNQDMRNIGIQNSLESIQNLDEHLRKLTALNGSYGKSFEQSISKNEVLKTQVQTLRAENMGADIAEAYNKLQNLSANYNAVLSSSGKINKMSILDYL